MLCLSAQERFNAQVRFNKAWEFLGAISMVYVDNDIDDK